MRRKEAINIDGSGRNRELSIEEERRLDREATLNRMDEIYDIISKSYDKLADVIYEVEDFDHELGERLDKLVDDIANFHIAFGRKVYGTGDEDERGWEEC